LYFHCVPWLLNPGVVGGDWHNIDLLKAVCRAIDVEVKLIVDNVIMLIFG